MTEPDDTNDAAPRSPPGGLAVIAWGLVLFAGCRGLEIFLEAQATALAVGQAVMVEWGSSRLGIAWSDPAEPTTTAVVARRAVTGLGLGGLAAVVVVGVLAVTGGASFERLPSVEGSVLAIGFITAALHAWRDELLLHGVALRALGGFVDARPSAVAFRILACGATSAGAALGRSDANASSVAVAFFFGAVLGALWLTDRGAWLPWGANTAFHFAIGTLFAGGFVQTRVAAGPWAGGDRGILGGGTAAIALAPVALAAVVLAVRRISPRSARVG